ncbi:Ty1/Copia family ribonuclease HI [Patescibacteria group bacterium]|nr:Ty1/Copia family ribonuclease HI [Patescibacteria group bacterium]
MSKRILRYLKGTKKLKLTFEKSAEVAGYSDASYAEDKNDRKSTGGYVFMMNGGAVSWKSSKQKIVTMSSCEAEYVTLSDAAKEAIWLTKLMKNVDKKKILKPIRIYEDNQSTIKTAKNPIQSERTKHIDVRHHFIREKVAEKRIEVEYISTTDQIADIFTKSLGRVLHMKFTGALGLR